MVLVAVCGFEQQEQMFYQEHPGCLKGCFKGHCCSVIRSSSPELYNTVPVSKYGTWVVKLQLLFTEQKQGVIKTCKTAQKEVDKYAKTEQLL